MTLKQVFTRFRQHNLKITPKKCHIGTGSISYLGYGINAQQGVMPGLAKTVASKISLLLKQLKKYAHLSDLLAFSDELFQITQRFLHL